MASKAEEKPSSEESEPSQTEAIEKARKAAEDLWRLTPPHFLSELGEREKAYFTDPTGGLLLGSVGNDDINLTISRKEFDHLTAKTREILSSAALAQQRIAKDQEEIDLLKTETRETLKRLRAA